MVMIELWSDREDFLRSAADNDLRHCCDEVHPCLLAFRGDDPLFAGWLRPFAQGDIEWTLFELLTLGAALDADRLALSAAGRAWSQEDPIPPVVPGVGDLRQRVLALTTLDGADRAEPERSSMLVPFEQTADGPSWGDPLRLGPGEGRIENLMLGAMIMREELVTTLDETREQLDLCVLRGHEIVVHDLVAEELGLDRTAT
jgi:hypothetical protein